MEENKVNIQADDFDNGEAILSEESIVSFQSRLPLSLKEAMNDFIDLYPNWDQYRLIQAALAGFLVQNGVESRQITRLYVGNMFASNMLIKGK